MPQARTLHMPPMPVKFIHTHLGLAGMSCVLLLLAFPRPGWGWLAHVALVPMAVLAIRSYSAKRLAWTTWLAGWVWWLVMIRWMVAIDVGGYVMVAAFLALYWPAAMLLVRWFHRCYRSAMVITLPMAWVSLEIIRGLWPAGGWGWYCLAHSQAPFLPTQAPSAIIQCADLFGEPTVSFLVAMSNGLLVDLVTRPLFKPTDADGRRRMSRTIRAGLCLWGVAMTAAVGYGVLRVRDTAEAARPGIEVAVVQTNEAQNNKERPTLEGDERDFNKLVDLTRQAAAARPKPDLIVWPETVLPEPVNPAARKYLDAHPEKDWRPAVSYHRRTADLARSLGVDLLAGAPAADFDSEGYPYLRYNAVFLYEPDGGQYAQWYAKIHRVPFGEYIPWVEDWPWLKGKFIEYLTPYKFDYTLSAGADVVVFPIGPPGRAAPTMPAAASRPGERETSAVRVVTPICFEDTIPLLTRRMVYGDDGVKQADMLVNLTNDGWFTGSDEPLQHLQIAVFRSVELRVPTARAVNTGVSGFIDSAGRIGPVVETGGVMQGREGWAVARVKLDSRSTLFGLIGALPGWVLIGVTGVAAGAGWLRRGVWPGRRGL